MTRKLILAAAVLALASSASAGPNKRVEEKKPGEKTSERAMDMSKLATKQAEDVGSSTANDRREGAKQAQARSSTRFVDNFKELAKKDPNPAKALEALEALDIAAADPAIASSPAMIEVLKALKAADGNIITVTKAIEDGMAKAGKKVSIQDIIDNCKKG